MEITSELLKAKGFKSDHPNNIITSFKLTNDNPKWIILLSRQYGIYSNKLIYECDCKLFNDKGIVVKHASLSNINTVEELNSIIKICKINYEI